MIKHAMVFLLVLVALSGVGSAASVDVYTEGTYTCTDSTTYTWKGAGAVHTTGYSHSTTNFKNGAGSCAHASRIFTKDNVAAYVDQATSGYTSDSTCDTNPNPSPVFLSSDINTDYTFSISQLIQTNPAFCTICTSSSVSGSVTFSSEDIYTVSGATECLDAVRLEVYDGSDYQYHNYTTLTESGDSYSFPVFDNHTYQLTFYPDLHGYMFTVDGDNVVYDYDDCTHTQYRFEESCGNLIPDSEGEYCEFLPSLPINCHDYVAPSGILDVSNSTANKMYVYTDSFIGRTGWVIDPVIADTIYTLENPNIAWGLKVIVVNESDGELIDGAMVKVDQTCYCTDGYSTRQKMTVNGMVEYGDMSLQDASLFVMASGYKILDENTTGYSAFLSGRTNFSSKTWIVKMAPTWSNNTSTFYEPGYKVDIHFKNEDGNRTSQILDTDTEVYLYYENNNSNEEAMTLKFQSSSTHTHFIDVDSWTIAYDDIGHKTIPNADFTPWDYSYRAVIYNSSIYGWNITIPLTVRNGTKEEEQHYQNLTTNLWFRYAHDGRVDYRDDMSIAIHARSNNTTLMDIDVELWKDGVYLSHVNLTDTEFSGADFPYYYTWNPIYDYETGHNYTVLMYGFDRTLLETDYVECISDETTRKNKLTIGVKDSHGAQLTNAYVYLEDWGSLPTGSLYYNAYEGIDNGDYRYKATKPGYTGAGWDEVNLTDEDKIVWYILTEDYTATAFTQTKFEDRDIKGIFFPLMYFLLICLILGGLKYVAS